MSPVALYPGDPDYYANRRVNDDDRMEAGCEKGLYKPESRCRQRLTGLTGWFRVGGGENFSGFFASLTAWISRTRRPTPIPPSEWLERPLNQ
jgi:hypothetical protein